MTASAISASASAMLSRWVGVTRSSTSRIAAAQLSWSTVIAYSSI
ncbi:MAG TPA: hypothetical protein VHX59_01810 [Mycobacteriales bacterium]|nr:hypothetical protein [Mycobacteriales bacterium]